MLGHLVEALVELNFITTRLVSSFVCGNDITTALLTGYGKTICFTWLPVVYALLTLAMLHVFLHLTKHDFDITGFHNKFSFQ